MSSKMNHVFCLKTESYYNCVLLSIFVAQTFVKIFHMFIFHNFFHVTELEINRDKKVFPVLESESYIFKYYIITRLSANFVVNLKLRFKSSLE